MTTEPDMELIRVCLQAADVVVKSLEADVMSSSARDKFLGIKSCIYIARAEIERGKDDKR